MLGVRFNDIHNDDLGLILTDAKIGAPVPHTSSVSVAGRDGDIDLTDVFTGGDDDELTYDNREIKLTFKTHHRHRTWAERISDVLNKIHGRKMRITFDDDAAYYYYGRCMLDEYSSSRAIGQIVVNCDVGPYKILINSPGTPWEWDPFSFVDGVIYDSGYAIRGSRTVTLPSGRMRSVPTFTCSAAMQVAFEGTAYSLAKGTNRLYGIRLREGDNALTFTGTGTVDISYERGSL